MQGEHTPILFASVDKIVKVWAHDTFGEYIPKSTVCTHKGELTSLAVHPTNSIFTLPSVDKTYSLHDITTFNQISWLQPSDAAFTSLAIHPDGTLLALGTQTLSHFQSTTTPKSSPNKIYLRSPLCRQNVLFSYKLLKSLHCAALTSPLALEYLQDINSTHLLPARSNFLIRMDTMANTLYYPLYTTQSILLTLYYPQKPLATDLLAHFRFLSPTGSSLLLCFLILILVENLISMVGLEEPGVIAMLMFISCFSWHSLLSYCLHDEEIPHLFYVFWWWLHSLHFEITSRTSLDRTVHSVLGKILVFRDYFIMLNLTFIVQGFLFVVPSDLDRIVHSV